MSETGLSLFDNERGQLSGGLVAAQLDGEIDATAAAQLFEEQYKTLLLPRQVAVWSAAADLLIRHGQPMLVTPIHDQGNQQLSTEQRKGSHHTKAISQSISTGLLAVGEPTIIGANMGMPVLSISADSWNPVRHIESGICKREETVSRSGDRMTLLERLRLSKPEEYSSREWVNRPYAFARTDTWHESDKHDRHLATLLHTAREARFSWKRNRVTHELTGLINQLPNMHIWTGFAITSLDLVDSLEERQAYGLHKEQGKKFYEPKEQLEDVSLETWLKHVPILPGSQRATLSWTDQRVRGWRTEERGLVDVPSNYYLDGRDTFVLSPPSTAHYEQPDGHVTRDVHEPRIAAQLRAFSEVQAPLSDLSGLLNEVGGPLRSYSAFRQLGATAISLDS